MRKHLLATVSALSLLGWLLVATAIAQTPPPKVEITAVHTATTPVQVGQDVHIGVTYTVVGTQTVPTSDTPPYTIDVDVQDDSQTTVASCHEPLSGVIGLAGGQDNTYTCTVIIPREGTFAITATLLNSDGSVSSQATDTPTLIVEPSDNILSNGVLQLFAGLAIFSAVMLIVAVGTETVIDSVKVALGLKSKVTSLQALNQLQTLLPGQLEGLGVSADSQKQVAALIDEMTKVVTPVTQLPDLAEAIRKGDITQFTQTLTNMAPGSTAVLAFNQSIQTFIHTASNDVAALKNPLLKLLSSLSGSLRQVQANPAVQKELPKLDLDSLVIGLTDIEGKLNAIVVEPDKVGDTFTAIYTLFADSLKLLNDFLDKLQSWADGLTADWLRQERDVLLQESKQTVLDNFNTTIKPLLQAFGFLAPNLANDAQAKLTNFLINLDGVATSSTDVFLRSVDNLLHGVEIRRFHTQSPLRKLWRRLRKAGAAYGFVAICLVAALLLTLIGSLLRPLLPALLTSESLVVMGSLGVSAGLVVITAVFGYLIYHIKHDPSGKRKQRLNEQTPSPSDNQPPQTTRQRLAPWVQWAFGNPTTPTILSYIEVFWNWLHGKTNLDPAYFDQPPTLNQAIAKSLHADSLVAEVEGLALTAENLAQVVLLRTNQQLDEEKTRKRLMRVLAMFIGTILAYLLQIDAAALLDSALPGTSGLVNGLFVIQGSFLHIHWPFLPATLNITPGIILTGLAASAGSAFWHDQLERLQAAKEMTKTAVSALRQAQGTLSDLGE